MTVQNLIDNLKLTPLCVADGDTNITGGYTGDLLSWVMGNAKAGDAWLTIMSNINIVAVAALNDIACIILCEGVTPETDVLATAKAKGVTILQSNFGAFDLCAQISKLI